MDQAQGESPVVDGYLDLALKGEAPPLEEFLAKHPELGAAEREKLRKLERTLGKRSGGSGSTREVPFETLGPYRLISRLGSGGMGMVFLAEDQRLGRQLALKFLRPELATSPIARARFEREGRALARLRHENVVTVFEAGVEGETPFLAMEFVAGKGLDELFADARHTDRRVPVLDLVRWGAQVARALAEAHELGVLHRDVKPANIRITTDGQAKLVDFGLALDPDSASLSMTGHFHGTLHYVAPEQIGPRGKELDGRCDVWSLGVTLYEGLTGRIPFDGETAQAILSLITQSEPIAPRRLVPALSREIDTIVLKALEKQRERRYASADALADDLEAVLDLRPIQARPSGAVTRVWKWTQRKPGHAVSIALGALLFVGGPSAYAILQVRHAAELSAERDAVVQQSKLVESRSRLIEKVADFQTTTLRRVEPASFGQHALEQVAANAREAWRADGLDEDEIERRATELARLLQGVDTREVASRLIQSELIAPALAALDEDLKDQPIVQARMLFAWGQVHFHLRLGEEALALFRRSEALFAQHIAPNARETLIARAEVGQCLLAAGRLDQAEELHRELLPAAREVFGREHIDTLNILHDYARVLQRRGRFDEAEPLYREAIEGRTGALGAEHADTLTSCDRLAAVLEAREKRDEAIVFARRAFEGRRRALPPNDEDTIVSGSRWMWLLADLGRFDEAQQVCAAMSADAKPLGADAPLSLALEIDRGELLVRAKRFEEAARELAELAPRCAAKLGDEHDETRRALEQLELARQGLGAQR